MNHETPATYTPSTLRDRYQVDVGEAERLIASFGDDRHELDRLLGAQRIKVPETIEELASAA